MIHIGEHRIYRVWYIPFNTGPHAGGPELGGTDVSVTALSSQSPSETVMVFGVPVLLKNTYLQNSVCLKILKNPDPSKVAILRTQKHPCYRGSTPFHRFVAADSYRVYSFFFAAFGNFNES